MNEEYEILLASRSWSNESAGREMYGCLGSSKAGTVLCFFPNKRAAEAMAKVMKLEMPAEGPHVHEFE